MNFTHQIKVPTDLQVKDIKKNVYDNSGWMLNHQFIRK